MVGTTAAGRPRGALALVAAAVLLFILHGSRPPPPPPRQRAASARARDVGVAYTRNRVMDSRDVNATLAPLIASATSLRRAAPDVRRCVFTDASPDRFPPGLFDKVLPAGAYEPDDPRLAAALALVTNKAIRSRFDRLVDRLAQPYAVTLFLDDDTLFCPQSRGASVASSASRGSRVGAAAGTVDAADRGHLAGKSHHQQSDAAKIDIPNGGRGAAAAATWIFRGGSRAPPRGGGRAIRRRGTTPVGDACVAGPRSWTRFAPSSPRQGRQTSD